ncbi:MAG: Bax inhibitor-1 family protein, partial [Deltaproteobacteria bacterium]|nr:Bax inhibitor-1 family protein [Deltaproteobacteria bacterium]
MQTDTVIKQRTEVLVNSFVRSVYNWMCIGLALTGFIAYYVSSSEAMVRLVFGNSFVFLLLILAELALVFSISGMVNRMSAGT